MPSLTLLDLSEAKANIKMSGDVADISQLNNPSPGLLQALMGVPASAGKPVTRDTAVRVASFLSAVKMLCNDVAKMPLILHDQKIVKGVPRTSKAIKDPRYSLLKDVPNPWQTSFQLRWHQVFQLLTHGNFYTQIVRSRVGLLHLIPLNAWFMQERWDFSNPALPVLEFKYDDGRGNARVFKQSEIWHGSLLNINGYEGASVLALAKEALSIMMASDEVAGRFFANGLHTSGFLTSPPEADIDETQAQKVVDELKKDMASSVNAGKFGFLPGGMQFVKMGFTAVEAQLLESRKWNAEEVARLLGGAPLVVKLGYGDKNSTYASSSAFLDEYFNTTLLPITMNIEQTIIRDLIDVTERGSLFAKHDANVILRGSLKERAELDKINIDSGKKTPNECRISDDLDPQEGLDYFHVNQNCILRDGELITVGVRGVGTQDEPDSGAPPKLTPNSQPPDAQAPPKPSARFQALAEAAADRVVRKFEKAGSVEPKFLAEVMSISLEKATEFCSKGLKAETMKAELIALATQGD
ncbi:MAG TPA: phage portal protein [Terriglobales bacterium]|nr:phage portal protein [Terriglobales bacterium]